MKIGEHTMKQLRILLLTMLLLCLLGCAQKDPAGNPYYWLSGVYNCLDSSPEADYRALENSYASIVPMQVDFTAYSALEEMKKRFENVEKR